VSQLTKKRLPESSDFFRLASLHNPVYSRAGWVAYEKRFFSWSLPDEIQSSVVLVRRENGAYRFPTAGGMREEQPVFSPDGQVLAFLSDCSGEAQIWLYDLESGRTDRVTYMRYGVSFFSWFPDGKRLLFLSPSLPGEDEVQLQTPLSVEERKIQQAREFQQPWVTEELGYRDEASGSFVSNAFSRLWVIAPGERMAVALTPPGYDVAFPVSSPDGRLVAFLKSGSDTSHLKETLCTVSTSDGKVTEYTHVPAPERRSARLGPVFSSDGGYIIYAGRKPEDPGVRLYRVSLDQPCTSQCLLPDSDPDIEIGDNASRGRRFGHETRPLLQVVEQHVLFPVGRKGSVNVCRVPISAGSVESLTVGERHVSAFYPDDTGGLIYVSEGPTSPPEIYSAPKGQPERRLTKENGWAEEVEFVTPKHIEFPSLDGTCRIHGWGLPPHRYERAAPTILRVHGGPNRFYGNFFSLDMQVLAAAGFGVIYSNPRGSSSYGSAFGAEIHVTDGTDLQDILLFTRRAAEHFDWIDEQRLGICGSGHGGTLALWAICRSDLFKAAVVMRTPVNRLISYASSDLADGGSAREMVCFTDFGLDALKRSVISYVDNVSVPVLVLHGTADMRCDVAHAHQLFTALKDYHPDLPVHLTLFPGYHHGFGSMAASIAHDDRCARWFSTYL